MPWPGFKKQGGCMHVTISSWRVLCPANYVPDFGLGLPAGQRFHMWTLRLNCSIELGQCIRVTSCDFRRTSPARHKRYQYLF
jgi:hypothetical protein